MILRLSSEPIISLPADPVQRAGWQDGMPLQVLVSPQGLDLRPAGPVLLNAADWPTALYTTRQARLRERAEALGLYGPDRRDEEYWQIVAPLMEKLDSPDGRDKRAGG